VAWAIPYCRVLKADLTSITANGGTGKGNLTVDASSDMLALHHELEITGVKAQPFLAELIGINKISFSIAPSPLQEIDLVHVGRAA
jgi:hypothetical protein